MMAADLSVLPHTGLDTQLCGDAHVRNLGAYAAPDGRLVFDINDFDETIRGPFEWDLKRMATSLILAGRETGAKSAGCMEAAAIFLSRYRRSMRGFARMSVLELARYQVHRLQRIAPVSQALRKAERETPQSTLARLTTPPLPGQQNAPEHRIFVDSRPLQYRVTSPQARKIIRRAHSLPGKPAAGAAAFSLPLPAARCRLPRGRNGKRRSARLRHLSRRQWNLRPALSANQGRAWIGLRSIPGRTRRGRHHGRRVAEGQRAMQLQSDVFLGWTTINNRHYLVRQLNDHKASIDVEDLKDGGLTQYAEICGELLARGHARAGDPLAIEGYLGGSQKCDSAVTEFAVQYADQTDRDYETFLHSRFAPRAARRKAAAAKSLPNPLPNKRARRSKRAPVKAGNKVSAKKR